MRHGSSFWAVTAATMRRQARSCEHSSRSTKGEAPASTAGCWPWGRWSPRTPNLALYLLGSEDQAACAHAAAIARESGGNPFFVAELVRYVQADTGLLRSGAGGR